MKPEQKEIIFNCILMIKGALNNNVMNLEDSEILEMLEKNVSSTMIEFWDLIDENKKLKEANEILRNF
jgi:hypothetical protein